MHLINATPGLKEHIGDMRRNQLAKPVTPTGEPYFINVKVDTGRIDDTTQEPVIREVIFSAVILGDRNASVVDKGGLGKQ